MYRDNSRTLNLGSGNFIPGGDYDAPNAEFTINQRENRLTSDQEGKRYTADSKNWQQAVERSMNYIQNTPDNQYNASTNYDNSTQNVSEGTNSERPQGGSNNKVSYSTNASFSSRPLHHRYSPSERSQSTESKPGMKWPTAPILQTEGQPVNKGSRTDNLENNVSFDTSVNGAGDNTFQNQNGTSTVGQDFGWKFGGKNDGEVTAQGIGGWNINNDAKADITNDVQVNIGANNEFGVGATVGNNYAISFVNQGKDNPFSNMERAVQYSALNDNFLARSRGRLQGASRGADATETAERATDIRGKVKRLYNSVGEAQKYYQDSATDKRVSIFGGPTGTPSWKAPQKPRDEKDDDD